MPTPRFTSQTLRFLRALKLHNDREWFREHRDEYEEQVKGPMVALHRAACGRPPGCRAGSGRQPEDVDVSHLPRHALLREQGAVQDARGRDLPAPGSSEARGRGSLRPRRDRPGIVGGGLYRPQPRQLLRLREHIAANSDRLRALVAAPAFRRNFGELSGRAAQAGAARICGPTIRPASCCAEAVPRGCEHPATFATARASTLPFYGSSRHVAPLIDFLNAPLAAREFRWEKLCRTGHRPNEQAGLPKEGQTRCFDC